MNNFQDAKRFLHHRFNLGDLVGREISIKKLLGLCCLGIKETPERTGYYRRIIRETFNKGIFWGDIYNKKPSDEKIDNIIELMTEKPTVAALVIGCGEEITKFLNPTEEEIKESEDCL